MTSKFANIIFTKLVFTIVLVIFNSFLFSQTNSTDSIDNRKSCFTAGILQGGGSLVGIDMEFLVLDNLGLQIGGGIIGYGGGINIHFKPQIRSSFVSLQYWNQGIGKTFTQSLLGATYVYRSKKWFTFQVGIGKTMTQGPAWPVTEKFPEVELMYSVGAYFPF